MNLSEKLSPDAKTLLIPFLKSQNLNLTIDRDGTWTDQKITFDVVMFICDCIINNYSNDFTQTFSRRDIESSDYFNKNVQDVFSKPSTKEKTSSKEYDKFVGQPLKLLSRAGVLECNLVSGKNIFKVINVDVLKFISFREVNSLEFIYLYFIETFIQSGFINYIENFIEENTKENFNILKKSFNKFEKDNSDKQEDRNIGRRFAKVVNSIAFMHNVHGTDGGYFSKSPIYRPELMYNRINFRDAEKEKGITRQQWQESKGEILEEDPKKKMYLAKKLIKQYHDFISEAKDEFSNGLANEAHHIFMKSEFPEISYYKENIIALTPTQHYTKAHPDGNRGIVDFGYQQFCLISKLDSVCKSISLGDDFYSLDDYKYVVNVGRKKIILNHADDKEAIIEKLSIEYNKG